LGKSERIEEKREERRRAADFRIIYLVSGHPKQVVFGQGRAGELRLNIDFWMQIQDTEGKERETGKGKRREWQDAAERSEFFGRLRDYLDPF
jgi:hypothetical protein